MDIGIQQEKTWRDTYVFAQGQEKSGQRESVKSLRSMKNAKLRFEIKWIRVWGSIPFLEKPTLFGPRCWNLEYVACPGANIIATHNYFLDYENPITFCCQSLGGWCTSSSSRAPFSPLSALTDRWPNRTQGSRVNSPRIPHFCRLPFGQVGSVPHAARCRSCRHRVADGHRSSIWTWYTGYTEEEVSMLLINTQPTGV